MALVVRYVNTGSSAGGDGTTNATSGANRAYVSLSEWNGAEAADLVTATNTHDVYCDGGADSTYFALSATWKTSAAYFIRVLSTQEHGGVFDSGKYHWAIPTLKVFCSLGSDRGFFRLDGIQVEHTFSSDSSSHWGALATSTGLASGDIRVENVVAKAIFAGAAGTGTLFFILIQDSNATHYLRNNVVYDYNVKGGSLTRVTAGSPNIQAYNNTLINCVVGIRFGTGGTKNCTNNIFQNCTIDTTNVTTGGNNLSDKSSGLPGSGNVYNSTLTFADAGNDNYHLVSGDTDAIAAGIGPSSDSNVLTTDVDGDARSGTTCDIGFDEYVAAGGTFNAYWAAYSNIFIGEFTI